MHLPLVLLLGLGLIARTFGQEMRVPVVSGHPFSAVEVDVERPSPDVHNVPPKQTIRVYRDSAGRTRVDAPAPPYQISTHFAVINDPLAGSFYTLDLENKIARRTVYLAAAGQAVRTTVNPADEVRFYRPGGTCLVTPQSDPLGTELFEGLMAQGTRITTRCPEPPGGDVQENIKESWFSPELQMTLRIQVFNSIMGNRTINLQNIDRAEPDSSLFQVPPDYTMVDPHANRPAK
jgi:hypothetical protein